MFYLFALTTLLLSFIVNSPQIFVKGMDSSKISELQKFSLIELSLLIRILNSIENKNLYDKNKDETNKTFQEIIFEGIEKIQNNEINVDLNDSLKLIYKINNVKKVLIFVRHIL
jgi:hypothetical protein